jgi:hypothetical protein
MKQVIREQFSIDTVFDHITLSAAVDAVRHRCCNNQLLVDDNILKTQKLLTDILNEVE